MCNRCDGGNKPIQKVVCNECEFTFYLVIHQDEHEHEDSSLCPKCMSGNGVVVNELE